jgi:hypothetical protein
MTLSSRTMISSIPMTIFLDREAKHQTTISLSVKGLTAWDTCSHVIVSM